ncbi:uncharacterized protein C1orf43 homolog isoform X3 [Limulus polyphemus]|uniref:Uncharacterized protein C1orf43 homolog isoform X3 n=1 Tax=Limulus polyphemus TaxID=6850 RepID=A0ABM1SNM2_LIMPO|nr:uncharacterized protein C1orf43 homolog isoform X3 [Limulus polyphemus]
MIYFHKMADQLSGITVVIFIAFGVLTCILLFLFGKRQIARFSLKTRKGPHMPVGYSASKFVYMEIERRLERVKNITHEPVLLKEEEDLLFKTFKPIFPMHLYRMKAVDTLIKLENCLKDADPTYQRFQGQDLCMSLLQAVHKGVLKNCDPKPIRQFVDLYQSARHAPKIFDQEQFSEYMKLLSFILNRHWSIIQ